MGVKESVTNLPADKYTEKLNYFPTSLVAQLLDAHSG